MPGEVEDLRHAVLQHAERGLRESLDETSVLVLDRRFDHHARDVRLLDDLEGLEHHGVADLAAQRVGNGHGDLAPLEWVLVGPLDGVGRAILVGPEQLAVDEELDRAKRRPESPPRICATMRMLPGTPLRPSGEVIRTDRRSPIRSAEADQFAPFPPVAVCSRSESKETQMNMWIHA